ncbi:hypothetical protein KL86PLE_100371 [uncultured Pleomorphomonas sp.]|uniref:Uncharacterized protein n=1 Tax=uncultured Pleomorphomonas sp. TaxID=442121 RepID=A0A212L2T6_9HYPH|nr:hypothetical protein KL86PLE_100371 [uncultured Pleomorphomonas sp.]
MRSVIITTVIDNIHHASVKRVR